MTDFEDTEEVVEGPPSLEAVEILPKRRLRLLDTRLASSRTGYLSVGLDGPWVNHARLAQREEIEAH